MSVQVSSPEFTSDSVMFANKAAANAWRENLIVPSAAPLVEGVVFQAALPANVDPAVVLVDLASSYNSLLTALRNAGIGL